MKSFYQIILLLFLVLSFDAKLTDVTLTYGKGTFSAHLYYDGDLNRSNLIYTVTNGTFYSGRFTRY
ncbi:MAG TPA: hypothetical protein VGN20_03665 [Mucilaginibacter sp.]|jgi:hypothetical protein